MIKVAQNIVAFRYDIRSVPTSLQSSFEICFIFLAQGRLWEGYYFRS